MFKITKRGNLDLTKKIRNLEKFINDDLAGELGELAVTHFKKGFAIGGKQTDDSSGGWVSKQDGSQSHLFRTGKLINSIKVSKYRRRAMVTSNTPYSRMHNDGLGWRTKSGRTKSGGMPQREFIGYSTVLNRNSRRYIVKRLRRILK